MPLSPAVAADAALMLSAAVRRRLVLRDGHLDLPGRLGLPEHPGRFLFLVSPDKTPSLATLRRGDSIELLDFAGEHDHVAHAYSARVLSQRPTTHGLDEGAIIVRVGAPRTSSGTLVTRLGVCHEAIRSLRLVTGDKGARIGLEVVNLSVTDLTVRAHLGARTPFVPVAVDTILQGALVASRTPIARGRLKVRAVHRTGATTVTVVLHWDELTWEHARQIAVAIESWFRPQQAIPVVGAPVGLRTRHR